MERRVEVAIIGAGTAGLSAFKEVSRVTQDFVVINGGPHGTTCARVGCMPSKVLIQVANDFHRREILEGEGIRGGHKLSVDPKAVMAHVRSLRDRFVGGVIGGSVRAIGERNIEGYARFLEPGVLEVEGQVIRAQSIIIAAGSRPVLPAPWRSLGDRVVTSDQVFELETLPDTLAVVGLGAIGLELGQAMGRLGVEVTGFDMLQSVGGLTDPDVNAVAIACMEKELKLWLGEAANLEAKGEHTVVSVSQGAVTAQRVLASLGRRPNVDGLGLENIGVRLDERGIPEYDKQTLQVADLPLFIAGDVNADRSILHEASDEGRIAGYNAVRKDRRHFRRRAGLRMAFCEPNLAVVGSSFRELEGQDIAIGQVRFEGQGRSLIMAQNAGILRIYGHRESGKLLGAEMLAPAGEHLAHLLSWAVQQEMTVFDALSMPFYHPVIEEGLRTALRDLGDKVNAKPHSDIEMVML